MDINYGATSGQSNAQLATNAIAPYASQLIGDTFEHTDDPNKAAQLLSHAVLGAIIAYMNGGDAVSGAASATASELASMVLAKELYPEAFDEEGNLVRSNLSEEQAESIVAITNAIGALAGGITGGDVTNASLGSFIGENAVVNNRMLADEETRFINSQIDDYALAKDMSEERAKRILELAGESLVDGAEVIKALYMAGSTDITMEEILEAQVYLLQSSEGLTYYNYLDDTTRDLFEVTYGLSALLYYDPSDPNVSPLKIIATEVAVTLVAGKVLEIGGQVVKEIGKDLYEAGGKYYAKLSNGKVVEVEPQIIANRTNGIKFQDDALDALGISENTKRITTTIPGGQTVTVIPDALGKTIIEVKNVKYLSNSNQFRAYMEIAEQTGKPIELIVAPNTKISGKLYSDIMDISGSTIKVFDSATKTFTPYTRL